MNHANYLRLRDQQVPDEPAIHIGQISGIDRDRTLVYGYTTARETFHVYLQDRKIRRHIYRTSGATEANVTTLSYYIGRSFPISLLVPSKRSYPERCDYEFCRLLQARGTIVPFTTYNDEAVPLLPTGFYGVTATPAAV